MFDEKELRIDKDKINRDEKEIETEEQIIEEINNTKISKIIKMINSERYLDNERIQRKLVQRVINEVKQNAKEDLLNKAIEICRKPEFLNNQKMQSLYIKILKMQDRLEEAIEFTEKEEFKGNMYISSQRIGLLLQSNKLEEAIEICEDERYSADPIIQSQYIGILLNSDKEKDTKKVLDICNKEQFLEEECIQSQHITILRRLKRGKEALEICKKEKFAEYMPIKSQEMWIYKNENNFEEAEKIATNPKFSEYPYIQVQYIDMLINLDRIEEAKQILANTKIHENQMIKKIEKKLRRVIKEKYTEVVSDTEHQSDDEQDIQEENLQKIILQKDLPVNIIMEKIKQKSELEQVIYYTLVSQVCDMPNVSEKYLKKRNPYEKGTIEHRIINRLKKMNTRLIDRGLYEEILINAEKCIAEEKSEHGGNKDEIKGTKDIDMGR